MEVLEPVYSSQLQQLEQLKKEDSTNNQRIEFLYGRQGRGRQFNTVQERNTFLQHQIDLLRAQVSFVGIDSIHFTLTHFHFSLCKIRMEKIEIWFRCWRMK